jgi:hypothetical protein
MTERDLLIFTAVGTTIILGITGVGWYFFVQWYKSEESIGRKHIDTHVAEVIRDAKKDLENRS